MLEVESGVLSHHDLGVVKSVLMLVFFHCCIGTLIILNVPERQKRYLWLVGLGCLFSKILFVSWSSIEVNCPISRFPEMMCPICIYRLFAWSTCSTILIGVPEIPIRGSVIRIRGGVGIISIILMVHLVSPVIDQQICVIIFVRVLLVRSLASAHPSASGSFCSSVVLIVAAIRGVWWVKSADVLSLSATCGTSTPTAKEIARRGTASTSNSCLHPTLSTVLTILLHEVPLMLCFPRNIESPIPIRIQLINRHLAVVY